MQQVWQPAPVVGVKGDKELTHGPRRTWSPWCAGERAVGLRHLCRDIYTVANMPRHLDNALVASQDRLIRSLARAIRERRESLGARATQEEVAHNTRITLRQLQRIERGLMDPRLSTLLSIAKALRTNLQSLLDRAEELSVKDKVARQKSPSAPATPKTDHRA